MVQSADNWAMQPKVENAGNGWFFAIRRSKYGGTVECVRIPSRPESPLIAINEAGAGAVSAVSVPAHKPSAWAHPGTVH